MTEERYTLVEAQRELRRQECLMHGHSWEIISTMAGPVQLTCACGESRDVVSDTRPLGAASGGDPGFWDRLGVDDGLMPAHLPMGVLATGQGPVGDDIAHHYICWCGDVECPLTLALGHAWRSGRHSHGH